MIYTTEPTLDVEREAIKRLHQQYLSRLGEFELGSWADGHIAGALEAIERILQMEHE